MDAPIFIGGRASGGHPAAYSVTSFMTGPGPFHRRMLRSQPAQSPGAFDCNRMASQPAPLSLADYGDQTSLSKRISRRRRCRQGAYGWQFVCAPCEGDIMRLGPSLRSVTHVSPVSERLTPPSTSSLRRQGSSFIGTASRRIGMLRALESQRWMPAFAT